MTECDRTGPVVAGYAVMSGPIIPVELVNIDQQHPLYSHSSKANMTMVRTKNSQNFRVWMDPFWDADLSLELRFSTQNKQSELFCLMLFTWEMRSRARRGRSRQDNPSARVIVWFLVLEKSSTTGDACRRVGIGRWERQPLSSGEGDDIINEDWRITTIKLI